MIISSESFIEYIEEAYPDDSAEILETLNLVNIFFSASTIGIESIYNYVTINKATKFIAYAESIKQDYSGYRKLTEFEVKSIDETAKRIRSELYILNKRGNIEYQISIYKVQFALGLTNARRATQVEFDYALNRLNAYRAANPNAGLGSRNLAFVKCEINSNNVDNILGLDPKTNSTNWRSADLTELNSLVEVFPPKTYSWNRKTDAEYRILNTLAYNLKGGSPNINLVYTSFTGSIQLASEFTYCPACSDCIIKFNKMFPNIEIIITGGLK